MTSYADLTDGALADEITTWAGRVAAGEARLVALIGEFDAREAWAGPGLLSCAHWLTWRLGLGLTAARERVRVARALRGLPRLAAAFGLGQLSWTQVRAVTRVANPDDEQTWLETAQHATGAQIEKLVRGVRRARKLDEDAVDPELAAHRMRARVSYDDDGTMLLSLRLPAEQGAIVLAAVEQAREDLDARRCATNPAAHSPVAEAAAAEQPGGATGDSSRLLSVVPEGPSAEAPAAGPAQAPGVAAAPEPASRAALAEGFVEAMRQALDLAAATRPAAARRGRARLVAQVDPLSGWARLRDGELLPPTALSQLRDLPDRDIRPLRPADLERHDHGRRRRLPGLPLRELLGTVDGERCRFPGCTRHRRLHAHHVRSWSDGGPTDLANLVLLCGRHHVLVHRDGFGLRLDGDRRLTVLTAEGRPVVHLPRLPWRPAGELDPTRTVTADSLPPRTGGDRLDLRYAVSVLLQQAA